MQTNYATTLYVKMQTSLNLGAITSNTVLNIASKFALWRSRIFLKNYEIWGTMGHTRQVKEEKRLQTGSPRQPRGCLVMTKNVIPSEAFLYASVGIQKKYD
jgi:hypothetical protein